MTREGLYPHACRVADEWQALKHTWLERRLLPQFEDSRSEWAASDSVPGILCGIPARLDVARQLTAEMVDGYSPAHLVETGPLAGVASDVRSLIRDLVHDAYLDRGVVQQHEARMYSAISELDAASRRLLTTWADGTAARSLALDSVRAAAERLWAEMDALPGGIVLP